MKKWSGFVLGLGLLAVLAPFARTADAPKEAPGQARVLHVTYYFLPG